MLEIILNYLQNGYKWENLRSEEKPERQTISLRAFKLAGFGSLAKRCVCQRMCHGNELMTHIIHTLGWGAISSGEVEVTLRPQANQQLRRLCPGHTLIFSKCHQRCSRPQLRGLQKGRLLGEVSPSCKWSHTGGKGGGVAQTPYSPPRPFLPAW